MRILFADDDIVTRQQMTKMLKKFGYDVIEVADGVELLEYLSPNSPDSPDIIFTDILMPNLDGYAAAAIAKTKLEISAPMVAVTAIPSNYVVDIKEPFVAVLHKPLDAKKMLNVILTLTCPNCCCNVLSVDHKQHLHFDCKRCNKRYVLQEKNGELAVTEKI